MTENELAAAASIVPAAFNAQQQRAIDWPARPVIARAYLDQLERSDTLGPDRRAALAALLDRAGGADTDPALAAELTSAAEALGEDAADASGRTEQRLVGLAETLTGIAELLQ